MPSGASTIVLLTRVLSFPDTVLIRLTCWSIAFHFPVTELPGEQEFLKSPDMPEKSLIFPGSLEQ